MCDFDFDFDDESDARTVGLSKPHSSPNASHLWNKDVNALRDFSDADDVTVMEEALGTARTE